MITSLGKFLRILRLQRGEILKNMADRLGVSSAFLSAVENGKKKMPVLWFERLRDLYELDESQMGELRRANLETTNQVELNLKNATPPQRELAILFARQFNDIDEVTSMQIANLLNKQNERKK
ncbi:MAG: helix-turn-helix domain-containing protein [Pyramidobacter sp.]|nr:helix-turn-helix domain-containing protein [Pyramidobacter sp.]